MTTHTVAILEISQTAYDEIRGKLSEAGYTHTFGADGEIDMSGIAVQPETPKRKKVFGTCPECSRQMELDHEGLTYIHERAENLMCLGSGKTGLEPKEE